MHSPRTNLYSPAKTLKCGMCSCQLHDISFCVFELSTITHCHDMVSFSIPNNLAGL